MMDFIVAKSDKGSNVLSVTFMCSCGFHATVFFPVNKRNQLPAVNYNDFRCLVCTERVAAKALRENIGKVFPNIKEGYSV